jgi:hypothetical protein
VSRKETHKLVGGGYVTVEISDEPPEACYHSEIQIDQEGYKCKSCGSYFLDPWELKWHVGLVGNK